MLCGEAQLRQWVRVGVCTCACSGGGEELEAQLREGVHACHAEGSGLEAEDGSGKVKLVFVHSKADVEVSGKTYSLLPTMLSVQRCQRTVHGEGRGVWCSVGFCVPMQWRM